MRHRVMLGVLITMFFALHVQSPSRQTMKRITVGDDDFMIPEVGCMVSLDSGAMKVMNVLPAEMRPKEYHDVDLKEGDLILMVNAVRPKTVKELQSLYEKAAVGSELKFGVSRDGEKRMVSFTKADPKNLPKSKIVRFEGKPGEGQPLPGIGMVGMSGEKIVVRFPLPEDGQMLREKDILQTLNGKKLSSLQQLASLYDKIHVGDELEFGIERDGKSKAIKMKKPEAKGQVIIRK